MSNARIWGYRIVGHPNTPGLLGSPDLAGQAGAGTSEEYDTTSTGLTWNTAPATVDSNTTVKSHLYLATTGTTEHIGTKSWAPTGAFDARCKMAVGRSQANVTGDCDLYIADSSDSNRVVLQMMYP